MIDRVIVLVAAMHPLAKRRRCSGTVFPDVKGTFDCDTCVSFVSAFERLGLGRRLYVGIKSYLQDRYSFHQTKEGQTKHEMVLGVHRAEY